MIEDMQLKLLATFGKLMGENKNFKLELTVNAAGVEPLSYMVAFSVNGVVTRTSREFESVDEIKKMFDDRSSL